MNCYSIIFEDEDCIGRLSDIIEVFQNGLAQDSEDIIAKNALQEAIKLNEEDNDKHFWYCKFHPMGAYFFYKLTNETLEENI